MQLQNAVHAAFAQLAGSLEQLTPDQYCRPCERLGHSSVGQHVRHIIEMFQCLEKGYRTGTVNYEQRERNRTIETDMKIALNLLQELQAGLNKADKPLTLEGAYDNEATALIQFQTNYFREIVYNLEHTIHHMALIRVGLGELANMDLPESYGVASATVKYKKSCAQ